MDVTDSVPTDGAVQRSPCSSSAWGDHPRPASRTRRALVHPSSTGAALSQHHPLLAGAAIGLCVGMSHPVSCFLGPSCLENLGDRKSQSVRVLPSRAYKPLRFAFTCLEKNVSVGHESLVFLVTSGSQCWWHIALLTTLPRWGVGAGLRPGHPQPPPSHGCPVDCNILLLPNNGTA